MTEEDWGRFALKVHDYYGRPITDGWVELGYAQVHELDAATVVAALGLYQRGPRAAFMPNPSELVACAREVRGEVRDFDDVWGELVNAVRGGASDDPAVRARLSPEAEALVRPLGGWPSIRLWEEENMPTIRAQARGFYGDQARRRDVSDARARLRAIEGGGEPHVIE